MGTRFIGTPCTSAVHRLTATLGRALSKLVVIWASKTIVGCKSAGDICPAPFVAVILVIIEALCKVFPSTNTIDRLTTAICHTLVFIVLVGT